MNDIKERINKVKEYFREMQVTQIEDTSVIYVVASFPEKWRVYDDVMKEKYDVAVRDGREPGEYYFCAEMEVGFDKVFDAIDHCIGINKDAMERTQIFQEKLKELKDIFADGENTIKKLKTLEFTFPKPKKELKTPKKQTTENRQLAQQEIEDIYRDEYKK